MSTRAHRDAAPAQSDATLEDRVSRASDEAIVPRASDVAIARYARRETQLRRHIEVEAARHVPAARGWRASRSKATVGAAMVAMLLLVTIGPSPAHGAPRPLDPEPAVRVFDALPVCYPTSTPSPTPEPTGSPEPAVGPAATPWRTPPGIKGLDVSHWNGFPNFDMLRSKGMRFVFSKASQGTAFEDDTYQRHTREARAAGLLVGAYHFFDYKKDGVKQANHYLQTLRKTTGLGDLLPLVVDVECLKSIGTSNHTNARQRLHAMLDELYRQTGRYPMIYTSQYMWKRVVGAPSSFGDYPLWVACWKCSTIYMPKGWDEWLFWQVGQFRFNGGSLRLDGNLYHSKVWRLRNEQQRPMRMNDGARYAKSTSAEVDLRGFDGKEVRVGIDGAEFGSWQPYQQRLPLQLAGRQEEQEVRVQLRSFRGVTSPVVKDTITLDSVPPTRDGPSISIRQGQRMPKGGARVPVSASVSGSDATSGLASTYVKASCGGSKRAAKFSEGASAALTTLLDRSGCSVMGRARDKAGHKNSKKVPPKVTLFDARKGSNALSFKGGWTTLPQDGALGSTITKSASQGAQVRLAFEGAQVAVVAQKGPDGGLLRVLLDGKHVDTIDLYAKKPDGRRIVYVRNVPAGRHVLKLRVVGEGSEQSTGAMVRLDALLALDRRR